jgi:hypothetical protein
MKHFCILSGAALSFCFAFMLATEGRAQDCAEMLKGAPLNISLPDYYKQLRALGNYYSEYETITQFNERLSKSGAPDIIFGAYDIVGRYDADTATLIIPGRNISSAANSILLPNGTYALAVKNTIQNSRRNFIGQNAFGVSAKAVSVEADEYYLAFAYGSNALNSVGQINIPLSPSDAVSVLPFLELVVAAVPKSPAAVEGGHYSEATLDNPVRFYGKQLIILGRGICIGIRDKTNGTILGTAKLAESNQ